MVSKIYEIQNLGKGLLTEDNLYAENILLIYERSSVYSLQTVMLNGSSTSETAYFYDIYGSETPFSEVNYNGVYVSSNYTTDATRLDISGIGVYGMTDSSSLNSGGLTLNDTLLKHNDGSIAGGSVILPITTTSENRVLLAEGDVYLTAGDNIEITGNGTEDTPFLIEALGGGGGTGSGFQSSVLSDNLVTDDLVINLDFTSSLTITTDPLPSTTAVPYFSLDTNKSMSSYYGPYVTLGVVDDTFSQYSGILSGFRIGSQGYDYSHFMSAHVASGRSIELEVTSTGYTNFNWNALIPKGYVTEALVKQITIDSSIVLTSEYHGKTIYIDNGTDDITITIDGGGNESIYENGINYIQIFKAEFVQKGTGVVRFVATASAVLNLPEPGKNIIKGKNYRVLLEYQYTSGTGHNEYTLFGDLLEPLILDSVTYTSIDWNYPYLVDVEESQDNITFTVYDPNRLNTSPNDNYYPETWFRLHDVARNIYSNVIHYIRPE